MVFIGGLVRGFTDNFSDVDITVILEKKDNQLRSRIRKMGFQKQKHSGVDIDLEVHFLEDFRKHNWSEIARWEFSRARIVYDPKGRVKKLFAEKLKTPRDFWVRRIVICNEYLRWYCCPARKSEGTMAEAWVERGDLVSAHYCLSYAVDLLFRLVFALNKEYLPAPKWRIYYASNLKWLPHRFEAAMKEAMIVKDFSAKDFDRRLKAIMEIGAHARAKIAKETGLTPSLTSKYYVERILHQGT